MARRLRANAFAFALLFAASPASATSFFYIEAFTNSLLGNVHGTALLPSFNGDLSDFLEGTDLDVLGAGLGSGLVTPGDPLEITHTFAPGVSVSSVQGAWLVVSVVDDSLGEIFEYEHALIDVDGSSFADGQAVLNLFAGSVGGSIAAAGDSFLETIAAQPQRHGDGDFKVLFSALKVKFDGTTSTAPAIPEPSAALAFAAGLLLVGRRRKR
jgi:hypothetical protein